MPLPMDISIPVTSVSTTDELIMQHNADPPLVVVLDPQQLPATISFVTTGDGLGIETPPLADVVSADWWRDSGTAALLGYSLPALAALRPVADAAGNTSLGAALDVINASSTPTVVRDYVDELIAARWAHEAEGLKLVQNSDTTCQQIYQWGLRGEQLHDASALEAQQATMASVLGHVLPGGGTVYSVLSGIPQMASEIGSYTLGLQTPGFLVTGDDAIDVVSGGTAGDTIETGTGRDAVMGFEGNDAISTGAGCDWLWGGAGDDTLSGGADVDTAVYSGTKASYQIAKTGDGFTVSGADGVDTLVGIERLMFSDTAMALDSDGTAGQAYRMYGAAFGRAPDPGGLGYWIAALDSGAALHGVALAFMQSNEYKLLYGTDQSNGEFLTACYQNVLHRAPDAAGYAYWLGILEQHLDTTNGVLANLSESAENQAALIGIIGNGFTYTPYEA